MGDCTLACPEPTLYVLLHLLFPKSQDNDHSLTFVLFPSKELRRTGFLTLLVNERGGSQDENDDKLGDEVTVSEAVVFVDVVSLSTS